MIIEAAALGDTKKYDLCVVGAGPVGLALAFAAARRDLRVLVLEAGGETPCSDPELGRSEIAFPMAHASLCDANACALGGTSHWWGGRCIPFDPIDFAARSWVASSGWPIGHDDVAPFQKEAADFFNIGRNDFVSAPGEIWDHMDGLRCDELERWTPDPNIARVQRAQILDAENIDVLLNTSVIDLNFDRENIKVESVDIFCSGVRKNLSVFRLVLACGAVATVRLMLIAQKQNDKLFGGTDGPLGRYYMGHNFGKIAELVLDRPKEAVKLDYFKDHGVYVRRRFTFPDDIQRQNKLLQTSFAAGNAQIWDPVHRNGALSLIWLTLASPLGKRLLPAALLNIYLGEGKRRWGSHISNVMRSALTTFMAGIRIFHERYCSRPGKPAVFLFSPSGRYSVHYHAEQTPSPDNRITLKTVSGENSLDVVHIAFSYSSDDAKAIVRGHRLLDAALRKNSIGHLEFAADNDDLLAEKVLAQARDGMHQIGGMRMASDASSGVVDANCKVHATDNLYVASSAVFPTSGQANPTFLAATLAIRLAKHLSQTASQPGDEAGDYESASI